MDQTTTEKRVIGVDISTKSTTYAIVDVRGNIIAKESFLMEDFPNVANYVSMLSEKIVMMVMANGGYESVRSVGISAKSANFLTGSIENASNLPWKGIIPLAALLRDRMGLAVAVANNAHVAALAESAFGCAHGMKDFIVISLGSGLGSCIFSNGKAHLGMDGFAGEIGHTNIVLNGRECGCGNKGCLEAYTAAKGIRKTAQELMAESDEPSLLRSLDDLSPRTIADACEKGDKLAIETFRRSGHLLGIGLANYVSMLDPEAIVFTGGIPRAGKWILEPAEKAFNEHVFHNVAGKVKFMVSSLPEDERGILGASVLAWEIKEYSLFK